jgi:phage terminase large subunit-like protein
VAVLYAQGKVHHVGTLAQLEDQMCTFVPGVREGSPDRMDALVWALTELAKLVVVPRIRSLRDDILPMSRRGISWPSSF